MKEHLNSFLFLVFKHRILSEYRTYDDLLKALVFIRFLGLEDPLGLFSYELYGDLSRAFHEWHASIGVLGHEIPIYGCC